MLVGLIADTHDNLSNVEKAVKEFKRRGVELVLHAGDHNAPFTVAKFAELDAKLVGVLGNVDGEVEGLKRKYEEIGGELRGEFGVVKVEGVKIALLHGFHREIVEALALSGRYDVVVCGHTHQFECTKLSSGLIVNPGECCGYLTGDATIALLEVPSLKVEFIKLK